ncbi:hypothetical protein C8J57DRAFT_573640 [Mycena rebaudengoi]|nr:hypothetical protein C8J57DRAFT_573640 [Mycena rebaudengoi]
MSFLDKAVPACNALPDVHITLLSVEPDAPWTLLQPETQPPPKPVAVTPISTPAATAKLHPSLPPKPVTRVPSSSSSSSLSSSSKNTPSLFVDVSSTTYAVFPKRNLPLSLPPCPADLGLSLSFVPESGCSSPTTASPPAAPESAASPRSTLSGSITPPEYPHPLPLRPLSTTMLIRMPTPSVARAASMLHINLLAALPVDADNANIPRLHTDITRSYHELSVLSAARWKLTQTGTDPHPSLSPRCCRLPCARH